MRGDRMRKGATTTVRILGAALAVAGLSVVASTGAVAATKFPSIKPTVPTDVQVASGVAELVVSWSPPTYDGEWVNRFGVDVPYVITDYDLKGVPAKSWASCDDLSLSCTVTGLRAGHTYDVEVRVWNAKGKHSGWTVAVPGTPT